MTKDEVERFYPGIEWKGHDDGNAVMKSNENGEYVRHSDYAALLARAEAAEVRLSSTLAQRDSWQHVSREDALREAAEVISSTLRRKQKHITRWKDAILGKPNVKYRIARADVDARQSCRDTILALIAKEPANDKG